MKIKIKKGRKKKGLGDIGPRSALARILGFDTDLKHKVGRAKLIWDKSKIPISKN